MPRSHQPALGAAGLLVVLPASVLIAFGAGGAESSVRTLGPLVTFALPVISMVAFWWRRWPGTHLGARLSGPANTMLIVAASFPLTALGHLVTGTEVEDSMRLAVGTFAAMLQLTLVWDHRPWRRLGRVTGGLAALTTAWAIALAMYAAGVPTTLLQLIAAWQVWFFVLWKGWPFAGRAPLGTAVVLAGSALSYASTLWVSASVVGAAAASVTVAALVVGLLFDGWPRSRAGRLTVAVTLAGVLNASLAAYAGTVAWTTVGAQDWVAHVELNAIGASVLVHVAIWRRWPF